MSLASGQPAPVKRHARVAVIGCGGTISSNANRPLDTIDYPDEGRKLSVDEVLAAVPEVHQVADVLPVPYRAVSSAAMTEVDWFALRRKIAQLFAQHADLAGIVVLHGTATLEETAFFLHLTLATERPVIVVGAQRPLNVVGSDGPSNLIAALRVAGSPEAMGRGVLVVMNDEIHSARDVQKTSNYRVQSFRSLDYGMLGQVDGDRVVFTRQLSTRHTAASPFAAFPDDAELPRIDVLYSHIGADNVFVDAAIGAGAAGLVSASFAPGLLTRAVADRLVQLASTEFPIVICSRAATGRVANRRFVSNRGLIAGEDLTPQKARIALQLAVAGSLSIAQIRDVFAAI